MSNANEPAMPSKYTYHDSRGGESVEFYQGLTKREHYEGLAMQGYIAGNEVSIDHIPDLSIKAADALLKAQEKQRK